jgi:Zn-dependent protease with chaperone function
MVHGAQWLERTWVVVALAIASAAMLARLVLVVTTFVRGARSIRELHALSRDAGDVRIVDSERAFCFVAGGRCPSIYVSSRAWSSLSSAERVALIAHESAHVRQRDVLTRAVIEGFLVFAAPLVADRARPMWLQASERLCDARAADATGEPESVASAMVSLCRLNASRPVASLGFTPAAEELAGRVRAVLAGGPIGERAAAILGRAVLAASLVLVAISIVAAERLHHVFETLLG